MTAPDRILKVDDKWSVEYDPASNDRPIRWWRHGEPHSAFDGNNAVTAMFYALLEARATPAAMTPAAMTPEVRALVPDAMRQMIVQAVRFANLAAGEGICIDDVEPETFLFDYSQATDDEDWHTLADRVDAALREGGDA